MSGLPALDLHAHLMTNIGARDIAELGALVFAATRSLDEFEETLSRRDEWAVWGVGCHPGLVSAQRAFDADRFAKLIQRTPLVSEVGLDGKARTPMELQRLNFRSMLGVLADDPRIASIHSAAAVLEVLEELEAHPIRGAVLHWWTGSAEQTAQALGLGCYFSVNAASVRKMDQLDSIPLDRLLSETDHPFGDRYSGSDQRPGNVDQVELALARLHGMSKADIRLQMWRNLRALLSETKTSSQLPRSSRVTLLAV
jgi:TatD DNase family protein